MLDEAFQVALIFENNAVGAQGNLFPAPSQRSEGPCSVAQMAVNFCPLPLPQMLRLQVSVTGLVLQEVSGELLEIKPMRGKVISSVQGGEKFLDRG